MSLNMVSAAVLLAVYAFVGNLDLGVGLLLPLMARGRDRDTALAGGGRPWSTGAIWTLVAFALVVASLPGSFAVLRALWPALVLMLLSLGLRGLLAAVRPHVLRQDLADIGFGLASLVAAACVGLILGWAVAGLGTDVPARHAGPLGIVSIWSLLCAASLVALSALLGAGWLIVSGRGAVQVFGREVGRAATILFGTSTVLCILWAISTGVAGRTLVEGPGALASVAFFAMVALTLLVPFCLTLWSPRASWPLACAALTALGYSASILTLAAMGVQTKMDSTGSAAYVDFLLLFGSPMLVLDLLRRRSLTRDVRFRGQWTEQDLSHAGRRSGALANDLHLC